MAKKKKQQEAPAELFEGTLVKSTGSWYDVRLDNGERVTCKLRGKFRIKGIKATNPVAVGDRVKISVEDDVGFIRDLLPRKNYVLRKSVNLARRYHVLCSNIDQAFILFTLADPVTTLGYVDKILVTCEAYHIPAVLVFNKTDLLDTPDLQQKLEEFVERYEKIGYETLQVSALNPAHADLVRAKMQDKTSFVVGRSGAGKSTLINLVDPDLNLKTGSTSEISQRGRHTTTHAEMFELAFGGFIIDSPGFKEMEIYDFDKAELSHFFPEMRPYLDECKFSNCIHQTEPSCAVKEAVEAGEIAESRYHTYLGMLDDIDRELPGYMKY